MNFDPAAYARLQRAVREFNPPSPAARHLLQPSVARMLRSLFRLPHEPEELATVEHEQSAELRRALGPVANLLEGFLIPLRRDMTAAGSSGSSYLVATEQAPGDSFIEAMRASFAGALPITRINGLTGDVQIPRITGGQTTTWLSTEGTSISPVQPTFGEIVAQPKTVGTMLALSRTFQVTITPAAERFVIGELSSAIAAEVDRALINGAGTAGEPTGLLKVPGIGSVSGTSLAYAGIMDMLHAVEDSDAIKNRAALMWACSPPTARLMRQRQRFSSTDTPILDDGKIAGLPVVVSNVIPDNTMIFGDWSRLWLLDWGVIAIDRTNSHDLDFHTGVQRVRAMFMCDVICAAPGAFCASTSIT